MYPIEDILQPEKHPQVIFEHTNQGSIKINTIMFSGWLTGFEGMKTENKFWKHLGPKLKKLNFAKQYWSLSHKWAQSIMLDS